MVVFDKQTAPKELINSPHYHSYSSAAFPTILFFGVSSLTSFCLALSLSRSHSTSVLCLTRLSCVCLFHPSPPPISKSRYIYIFSICHSASVPLNLQVFLLFVFFPQHFSSQILLVWPTISGVPLIQHDKCLFFPQKKRSRGRRYQREY